MISIKQARNVSTERTREFGYFPAMTGADAQRRRNAAQLRRRDNMLLPLNDTHDATAKSYGKM
jgi:hypothetical protein